MAASERLRDRRGYTREETALVESACLSVAVKLGSLMDDLCIVGGLVPTLIIDQPSTGEDGHPGTLDLDVGLSLALLDGQRYAEISKSLRDDDFEPDRNSNGNRTLQRWLGARGVTVDFLLPPIAGAEQAGRIQPLEADFGALVTPGLELAFDERLLVPLAGHTLKGERARRTVPVCGPGAFVALKALAIAGREKPKDAFDLVYTIRRWPGGAAALADLLAQHAERHSAIVAQALGFLARDFETIDAIGPSRVARFEGVVGDVRQEVAADAHGDVDDLLRACRQLGLLA